MINNVQSFLSLLALFAACVELDDMAEDCGFDAGFSAANWAEFAHDCQGPWVDHDGDVGVRGEVFPCEECVEGRDVAAFESFISEQVRLFRTYDPCYGEDDHDLVLDTKGHYGLGECEMCGDLYQSWNDHECCGTRGEAHHARMMG